MWIAFLLSFCSLSLATINFTLPPSALVHGGQRAIYLPNLSSSFPTVNFSDIDILYIPAGNYSFINIGGLPQREVHQPLYISNSGGQVRIGNQGHYYLAILSGGSNWHLTGRYDAARGLGHPLYQGHAEDGSMYAASAGRYGFFVDDGFLQESVSGVSVSSATNFTIEFVEVSRVGFAGFLVETDNEGNATMLNVSIHDNYIHDTGSEGLYLGSTQAQPHKIQAVISNNRFIRTGTEAIQAGHLIDGSLVENNVALFAAIDWLDAFQPYQDNNLQINHREGVVRVRNNIVVGAASALIQCFGTNVEGDTRSEGEQLVIEDNLFLGTRSLVAYVHSGFADGVELLVANNTMSYVTHNALKGIRPTGCWRHNSLVIPPARYRNNSYDAPSTYSLVEKLTEDEDGNAAMNSVTVEGAPRLTLFSLLDLFVDVNLPDAVLAEPLSLTMWSRNASLFDDKAITYLLNAHVLYNGTIYRAASETTSTSSEPTVNPDVWVEVGQPVDDVRLRNPWHGGNGRVMGLTHHDWTASYGDDDDTGNDDGAETDSTDDGPDDGQDASSTEDDSAASPSLHATWTLASVVIVVAHAM